MEIFYKMFHKIFDFLITQNIIYIKIVQCLNIRNSYIPETVYKYLRKFTDNCHYSNKDINYDALNELTVKANNLGYKLTIGKSINSGSISIVFDGYLSDKRIVIKLLRNGVKEKVKNSLDF